MTLYFRDEIIESWAPFKGLAFLSEGFLARERQF
jgi:hypothetical protein